MAQLTILDPFEGPGERLTAEYLAANLPKDWDVIANRKLPSGNSVDIDLFVLGLNRVFVVEEKYWGPKIALSEQRWQIIKRNGKSDFRTNPLNSVGAKSRKSAGWLRSSVQEMADYRGHFVDGCVILSYPELELLVQSGYEAPDALLQLQGCESYFLQADVANPAFSSTNVRSKVLAKILGLQGVDNLLSRIGDYEVKSEMPAPSGIRYFEAEHQHLGETVLLKCYDNPFWRRNSVEPSAILMRENESLKKLSEIHRTWDYLPPFEFLEKDWLVAPFRKPQGYRNLSELVESGGFPSTESDIAQLCYEAFQALSEVHAERVNHKILSPSRIWIGRGMRVIFSDFYLAHIDEEKSIHLDEDDKESEPFRCPTVALVGLGNESADVYSLAMILASATSGIQIGDQTQLIANVIEAPNSHPLGILRLALQDNLEQVPSARQIASRFAGILNPTTNTSSQPAVLDVSLEEGRVINARFELVERLGEGGSATTWKVKDRAYANELAVLKFFRDEEHFSLAREEFGLGALINHPRSPRNGELYRIPEPGFITYEYFPGKTLFEFSKSPNFTTERVRSLAIQTLEVLTHFHSKGFVHGDLSPKNIIVDENEDAALIDLGLVTKIDGSVRGGTLQYLAPELKVSKIVSVKTDLFSFAATFLRVMLNRDLNIGRFPRDLPVQVEDYLADFERQQWGDDGSRLIGALLRGLNADPGLRPDSASSFIGIIERAKPLPVSRLPKFDSIPRVNPSVSEIRKLYIRSKIGSSNILGLGGSFAHETYIETKLDHALAPQIIKGEFDVVVLTGNPGDGKTSFLQRLESEFEKTGESIKKNSSGWIYEVNGHEFRAILDASESHGDMSSDELVKAALSGGGGGKVTTLLAVNDGRLKQFFRDHEEEFPSYSNEVEKFFSNEEPGDERFLIVDLKARSLAQFSEDSLTLKVTRSLVRDSDWDVCNSCAACGQCPIYANRNSLINGYDRGLNYLVAVSHLRRNKRATLRQVRSAVSWAITGDLGCEDVHKLLIDETSDLANYETPNLVFSSPSGDSLIEEWRELDPANEVSLLDQSEILTHTNHQSAARRIYERRMRYKFFETLSAADPSGMDQALPIPFKHLNDFRKILDQAESQWALSKILLGISRIVGAPGFKEEGLAVRASDSSSPWTVLKPFPVSEFKLETEEMSSDFIESSKDIINLVHTPSGTQFPINLDRAELILRFASGMLQFDEASEAIRFDIGAFASGLARKSSKSLVIVQPSGIPNEVLLHGELITLELKAR